MGAMKNLLIQLQEQQANIIPLPFPVQHDHEHSVLCNTCMDDITKSIAFDGLNFCSNFCLQHYMKYAHYDEGNPFIGIDAHAEAYLNIEGEPLQVPFTVDDEINDANQEQDVEEKSNFQ